MPETIAVTLSRPIDAAELSRLWEAHVNLYQAPELVFSTNGPDVTIEYPSQPAGSNPEALLIALERALRAAYPDIAVKWKQTA